jgi:anhydro-N-acetylmuramic acid kinase
MSGSSLDGLDLAYCQISGDAGKISSWELLHSETLAFSPLWQARLRDLPEQSALALAKTDVYFGYYLADLVAEFRQKHDIQHIDAIASHGHTVFHQPERQFTLQIGSGAALSARAKCNVISDFRQQDIASGGEGAPLAPLADQYLWAENDFYLNLGGIANISANTGTKTIGFDVCYCNQVLNFYAQKLGANFDNGGHLARAGKINPTLLSDLKNLAFFRRRYPKSLGNEWIRDTVLPIFAQIPMLSVVDALATATHHIAFELAKAMQKTIQLENWQKSTYRIFTTGGGAHNQYLMESIAEQIGFAHQFQTPSADIINFKEAILMALLGFLRLQELPNLPTQATGGKHPHTAGALYIYR